MDWIFADLNLFGAEYLQNDTANSLPKWIGLFKWVNNCIIRSRELLFWNDAGIKNGFGF